MGAEEPARKGHSLNSWSPEGLGALQENGSSRWAWSWQDWWREKGVSSQLQEAWNAVLSSHSCPCWAGPDGRGAGGGMEAKESHMVCFVL